MSPSETIRVQTPRRKDRAIQDEAWIHDMLLRQPLGFFATASAQGPSLNPNLFVFDPEAGVIYLHTAKKGHTRTNVESQPRVAFAVAEMGRLLPAAAAVDFSVEYASVVVEGMSTLVEDPAEATHALDLLMRKYAPHLDSGHHYRGIAQKDLIRTSVFKIVIESWSGKGKVSEAADAYHYGTTDCSTAP